jgi:hypothetical protein
VNIAELKPLLQKVSESEDFHREDWEGEGGDGSSVCRRDDGMGVVEL